MGIAKIAGKNIDDLAKLMGKDIISLGDAVVGNVMAGKTFYAGSTTLLTGTLPTKAIVAGAETYEEGYHAGNPGGLSAIDGDLVTANIKSGKTIFGVAGKAEVVDTSSGDAVAGDIRTGKKAWVGGAEVTGNIPEVAIVAGSETVPAGIHTATTLSTIDPDLAVGNIKKDVNIFGKVGTYEPALTQLHSPTEGSSKLKEWIVVTTNTMPASAKKIVVALWIEESNYNSDDSRIRIVYNGVVKKTVTTGYGHEISYWIGDGLGSDATFAIEVYHAQPSYPTAYYKVWCYYVSMTP